MASEILMVLKSSWMNTGKTIAFYVSINIPELQVKELQLLGGHELISYKFFNEIIKIFRSTRYIKLFIVYVVIHRPTMQFEWNRVSSLEIMCHWSQKTSLGYTCCCWKLTRCSRILAFVFNHWSNHKTPMS